MTTDRRPKESVNAKKNIGSGPYLAKVISHLDPSFMGGLEVTLLRDQGNQKGEETQTYPVKYITPFYGSTAYEFNGQNKSTASSSLEGYNDTQKSYGMWFVPPDIGVTVLVIFVDGNPSEGYFIGCVPSRFMNHMVPAIAGSGVVDISADDKKKYATTQPLPVAEVNRRANDLTQGTDVDKIKKPIHPIADRFLEQGLLEDDIRGVTTSTSRREQPNMVFGISTPGPLDRRPGAKKSFVGRVNTKSKAPVPVSRLGGTTLVMDDGDDRYQRKTPPGIGPVEYVDTLAGKTGDANIPYNEYFRVRTRTGHQILLHNSEDLIYIGNSKGTAWVELTSNGKIDIHAEDSISIHTKNDLNIRADRDINLEAGRNVNIKATAEYMSPESLYNEKGVFDDNGYEKGRVQIESVENFNLLIGRNGKIQVRNDEDIQGNLDIKVKGNMRIAVQDKDEEPTFSNLEEGDAGNLKLLEEQPENIKGLHIYSYENVRMTTEKNVEVITKENVKVRTDIDVDIWSVGNVKIKTIGNLDINTDGNNAFTSGGTTDINSGGAMKQTAPRIDLNGPTARIADEAIEAVDLEYSADIADKIKKLPIFPYIITDNTLSWAEKKYFSEDTSESIMLRIPMHEPWPLHENFAPQIVTPQFTDREIEADG